MKKKTLRIITFILVTFLIARELLPFEISWFRSFNEQDADWNGTAKSVSFSDQPGRSDYIDLKNKDEIKFIFLNLDESYEESKQHKNKINVSVFTTPQISMGKWVPLVKLMNYDTSSTYNWTTWVHHNGKYTTVSGFGSVYIKGEMNIYGLCAAKTATREVHEVINAKIKQEAKNQIKKELARLEQSN